MGEQERCKRCGWPKDQGLHGAAYDYYIKIIKRVEMDLAKTESRSCKRAQKEALRLLSPAARYCRPLV